MDEQRRNELLDHTLTGRETLARLEQEAAFGDDAEFASDHWKTQARNKGKFASGTGSGGGKSEVKPEQLRSEKAQQFEEHWNNAKGTKGFKAVARKVAKADVKTLREMAKIADVPNEKIKSMTKGELAAAVNRKLRIKSGWDPDGYEKAVDAATTPDEKAELLFKELSSRSRDLRDKTANRLDLQKIVVKAGNMDVKTRRRLSKLLRERSKEPGRWAIGSRRDERSKFGYGSSADHYFAMSVADQISSVMLD